MSPAESFKCHYCLAPPPPSWCSWPLLPASPPDMRGGRCNCLGLALPGIDPLSFNYGLALPGIDPLSFNSSLALTGIDPLSFNSGLALPGIDPLSFNSGLNLPG